MLFVLQSAVTWLSFLWNSKRVVTTSKDGTIKLWNIDVRYHLDEDPKCLLTLPNPEIAPSHTVTADSSEEQKGKKKKAAPKVEQAAAFPILDRIAIAPDNNTLAISVGHTLAWLDLGSGEVIEKIEHAHDGRISSLVWLPVKYSVEGMSTVMCWPLVVQIRR